MRRFRILFVLFSLALLAPIALLVERAFRSIALERQVRQQTVAERIFDEMERGLSRILEGEEQQSLERYGRDVPEREPPFIVGRFQVDTEGTIAPLGKNEAIDADARQELMDAIASQRQAPRREAAAPPASAAQLPGTTLEVDKKGMANVARLAAPPPKDLAEQKEVSAFDALRSLNKGVLERADRQNQAAESDDREEAASLGAVERRRAPSAFRGGSFADSAGSRIDVPPMTGQVIDARRLMLQRTLVWGGQSYRQGVLLDLEELGTWLRRQGISEDLADYASVLFMTPFSTAEPTTKESSFLFQHRFAEPFGELTARLELRPLPGLASGTYVYALSALLLASGLFGLGALYRMVSVVVGYAERRNNFVAAVSHELKTPLTAIRMYGEMLRDGMVPTEAKRNEYYRHITVESERLSRLINNVLELSRLEKGNRDVALALGRPEVVMREVAELLRPHASERGFELDLDIEENLPPVRFERDALVQVLCNLVDNAVKYAGDAADRRIALRCRREGDGVSVAVRDRGPGVPARHLGKIFEPFYRGESELTRTSKGVGLGLSLVRNLAERMGARVSGHNVAGGGFEVEIWFRRAESSAL